MNCIATLCKFAKDYWPSMLTLAVILYATLAKDPLDTQDLPLFPGADKLVHAIMMGGLTGAIAFDRQRSNRSRDMITPKIMIIIGLCVTVFGGCDELAQWSMDNGRGGDIYDFLADVLGIVVAIVTAPPVIHKVLKTSSK